MYDGHRSRNQEAKTVLPRASGEMLKPQRFSSWGLKERHTSCYVKMSDAAVQYYPVAQRVVTGSHLAYVLKEVNSLS